MAVSTGAQENAVGWPPQLGFPRVRQSTGAQKIAVG